MKTYIDYNAAVHWCNGALILFNNIHEFDENFFVEEEDENGEFHEIFQYFLTNYSDSDVKWMQKTFPGIKLAYSEKMELWVLCVDHYGTSWDYVWTECNLPEYALPEFNDEGKGKITLGRNIDANFMRH